MEWLLIPFSWLYGTAMTLRNWAYDRGMLATMDAGVPVISVGNMTTGGTGKTPLVEYIACHLLKQGVPVGILSRGYRRRSRGVVVVSDGHHVIADAERGGDEPVQLARRLAGVRVVVAERRTDGARTAIDDLGAQILVLDDGFQHRSLSRTVNIVVVDARRDLSRVRLLPAGRRREPMAGLRRADLLAFSRSSAESGAPQWPAELSASFGKPMIRYHYVPESVRSVHDDQPRQIAPGQSARVFAFSGIGDHRGFVDGLRGLGMEMCGEMEFRDHHRYDAADLQVVRQRAREAGAAHVMTTEKDAAKLRMLPGAEEVLYLRIGVEIDEGRDRLLDMVDACLEKRER